MATVAYVGFRNEDPNFRAIILMLEKVLYSMWSEPLSWCVRDCMTVRYKTIVGYIKTWSGGSTLGLSHARQKFQKYYLMLLSQQQR